MTTKATVAECFYQALEELKVKSLTREQYLKENEKSVWQSATGNDFSLTHVGIELSKFFDTLSNDITNVIVIYVFLPLFILSVIILTLLANINFIPRHMMFLFFVFSALFFYGLAAGIRLQAQNFNSHRYKEMLTFFENQDAILQELPQHLLKGIIALTCYKYRLALIN